MKTHDRVPGEEMSTVRRAVLDTAGKFSISFLSHLHVLRSVIAYDYYRYRTTVRKVASPLPTVHVHRSQSLRGTLP